MKACAKCKIEKDIDQYEKNRAKKDGYQDRCRECRQADRKARYAALTPYQKSLETMSRAMVGRGKIKEGSYARVENRIGNSKQVSEYLDRYFKGAITDLLAEGKTPSVDRVDDKGHYEHGNVRVVDRSVNSSLGKGHVTVKARYGLQMMARFDDGRTCLFHSKVDASKGIGVERKTITEAIAKRNGRIASKGCTIEIYEG
ncbi:hypothetical protein H7T43_09260 [Peribacillus simplex]|uniref:hypothetical protein n=1 Tax=Peribacillus simplex TaxID=1478 RepID=UPI002989AF86|nr:hypothetical protein [Peribacillus simplex]MBX9955103.1 hypothetical protein [Peribacillus simplex]